MNKESTGYNGYSNWATWNLSLWLNNEEGIYKEMQTLIENNNWSRESAQILTDTWFPEGTPDMGSSTDLYGVNWDELVEANRPELDDGENTSLIHRLLTLTLSKVAHSYCEDLKTELGITLNSFDELAYLNKVKVNPSLKLLDVMRIEDIRTEIVSCDGEDVEKVYWLRSEVIAAAGREGESVYETSKVIIVGNKEFHKEN